MLKRGLQVILVQLLLVISLVSAEYVGFNPDTWNYNTDPYDKLNAPQVHQLDIAQVPDTKIPVVFDKLSDQQKQQLSGPQLSQIPDTQLGNLGQYNPSSLSQSLQSKGYDVAELRGDLNGATIQNQQITLADGSTYDLKRGKRLR